jgi:type II secretory pathway pseudopilin PulG
MVETQEKRRFRVSIGWVMGLIAVVALVLAPMVLITRQYQQVRVMEARARAEAELARAQAVRAQYLAAKLEAEQRAVADRESQAGGGPTAVKKGGLWAALGVNRAVFRKDEAKDLAVEFTLVNDGDSVADPGIGDSRVVINGKSWEDSGLILSNGPRDDRYRALPPGESLRFVYALGDRFKEPGVYRVSWRGPKFRSAEVVFRVLPE